MQFRIFNKSFLLKAFLEYFCICSAEHSCVKVQCRGRRGLPRAGACLCKEQALGSWGCCWQCPVQRWSQWWGCWCRESLCFTGLCSHIEVTQTLPLGSVRNAGIHVQSEHVLHGQTCCSERHTADVIWTQPLQLLRQWNEGGPRAQGRSRGGSQLLSPLWV